MARGLWKGVGAAFGLTERKDAVTRRASAGPTYVAPGVPYDPHWDLQRTIKDGYERVLWVHRIVSARALACSKVPVQVRAGEGEDAKPVRHRLNFLLNKQANRYETGRSLRNRVHAQFQISRKGVFVEVMLDRHGDLAELHLLNPLWVNPIPDPDVFVRHFEVRPPNGDLYTLNPWNPIDPASNTVLWIKNTHPFDPYASTTWMDAAGLSIDLDHYARLYNRTFMQNDGRPGGLLAIDGEVDTDVAETLQARLSGGVGSAGKVSIIGDAEHVHYIDTATSPRDAQYVESRGITKGELLVAGGTPLSVLGDASGRTFDNADAEEEAWWRQTNMADLELIGSYWDLLTGSWGDDLNVSYDLSGVAVLQREQRAREARAQVEWDKGLISLDEYRDVTGKDPLNLPASRANWMPAGRTPIAAPSDFDAIQQAYGGGGGPQPGPGGQPAEPPALPPGGTGDAADDVVDADVVDEAVEPPPAQQVPIEAGPRSLRELVGTKAAKPDRADSDGAHLLAAGQAAYEAQQPVIDAVAVDLAKVYADIQSAVTSRLGNANTRKHTRHWAGEVKSGAEIKVLDASKVVDAAKWVEALTQALVAHIAAAFGAAALDVATGLDWEPGDDGQARTAERLRAAAAAEFVAHIVDGIREHFTGRMGRIERVVREADESGADVKGIADAVSEAMLESDTWATGEARMVVGAMNAGGLMGATMAGATEKMWVATPDERTRPTHREASGQAVGVAKEFEVGEASLQYPGDPSTTHLEEVINCRCSLIFRVGKREQGTFDAELDADLDDLDAFEAKAATRLGGIARRVGSVDVRPGDGGWWAGTGFSESLVVRDAEGRFVDRLGGIGGVGSPDVARAGIAGGTPGIALEWVTRQLARFDDVDETPKGEGEGGVEVLVPAKDPNKPIPARFRPQPGTGGAPAPSRDRGTQFGSRRGLIGAQVAQAPLDDDLPGAAIAEAPITPTPASRARTLRPTFTDPGDARPTPEPRPKPGPKPGTIEHFEQNPGLYRSPLDGSPEQVAFEQWRADNLVRTVGEPGQPSTDQFGDRVKPPPLFITVDGERVPVEARLTRHEQFGTIEATIPTESGQSAIGGLIWDSETGAIDHLFVGDDYQRQGVATWLLANARAVDPNVRHSTNLTEDGAAFAGAVHSPLPAVLPKSREGNPVAPGAAGLLTMNAMRRLTGDSGNITDRMAEVVAVGRGTAQVRLPDGSLVDIKPSADLMQGLAPMPPGYAANGRKLTVGTVVERADRGGQARFGIVLGRADGDGWRVRQVKDGIVATVAEKDLTALTARSRFNAAASDIEVGDLIEHVDGEGALVTSRVRAVTTSGDVVRVALDRDGKEDRTAAIRMDADEPVNRTPGEPDSEREARVKETSERLRAAFAEQSFTVGKRRQSVEEEEEVVRLTAMRDARVAEAAGWRRWADGENASDIPGFADAAPYENIDAPPEGRPYPYTRAEAIEQAEQEERTAARFVERIEEYMDHLREVDPTFVQRGFRYVPDIGKDGGPGEQTLGQLREVTALGVEMDALIDAAYRRKVVEAGFVDPDISAGLLDIANLRVDEAHAREGDVYTAALTRYAKDKYGFDNPWLDVETIEDDDERLRAKIDLFGDDRMAWLRENDEEYAALADESMAARRRALIHAEARATAIRSTGHLRGAAAKEVLAGVRPMGGRLADVVHPERPKADLVAIPLRDLKVGDTMPVPGGLGEITDIIVDPATGERRVDVVTMGDGQYMATFIPNPDLPEHRDTRIEVWPEGADLTLVSRPDEVALAAFNAALDTYPTDWVVAAKSLGPLRFAAPDSSGRGYYNHTDNTISLPSEQARTDNLPERYRVAVHEVGHMMERAVPALRAMEWAFHFERTTDRTPAGAIRRTNGRRSRSGKNALMPVALLTGNGAYDMQEQARGDDYPNPYSGKEYGGGGPKDMWEVFTTTTESIFAGSPYADDEMRQWALGLMASL